MQHTILIEIHNHAGEVLRLLGLMAARGIEVEALSLTDGLNPNTSRLLVQSSASEKAVARIVQQLAVQVRVLKVELVEPTRFVEREMALISVNAPPGPARQEVISLANIFRAEIIDASANTVIIQLAAETSKIESLIDLLRPLGITDLARTGRIAVERAFARDLTQPAPAETASELV